MNRLSREADLLSKRGGKTRLEMRQSVASRYSHHLGEVILLKHIFLAWPPPPES